MKHGRAIAYMHLINFQREKYAKRAPIITFCPKDSLKHAANWVISAMSTIYISGKYFFTVTIRKKYLKVSFQNFVSLRLKVHVKSNETQNDEIQNHLTFLSSIK